jgi:hypothetical protein
VSDGRLDGVVSPQILIDSFRLGRRFHDYQGTCHLAFVTPVSSAGRPSSRACVLLATLCRCGEPAGGFIGATGFRVNFFFSAVSGTCNRDLLNCIPGNGRTMPFKRVARTFEEFKLDRSRVSRMCAWLGPCSSAKAVKGAAQPFLLQAVNPNRACNSRAPQ